MSEIQPSSEEIFFQSLDLPEQDRLAFIRAKCRGDEQIQEVERLIRAHAKNERDSFLVIPSPVPETHGSGVPWSLLEAEGAQIGRYRLVERIGSGGMGDVYLAEQEEGMRREVALKIIKLGLDTREVIARFEIERQAMAMFDHPCITKVYDAGATQTGRPYFVMELVRGRGIIEFADEHQLSLLSRLRIFRDVCQAVQHAHQKGIIHRDLKPSNILVTTVDGRPMPKVIDFGIAKAIQDPSTGIQTTITQFTTLMGTPQYMSPEQAKWSGADLDTRSDIYSLGAVLYELISGSPPIGADLLRAATPNQLYEVIHQTAKEPPSVRALRQAAKSSGWAARFEGVGGHPRLVELDWIVMKALSRERAERYASANELVADIDRFISAEPVLAAPPSRLYPLRLFVRRHWKSLATACAFVLLAITAGFTCLWLALDLRRANLELTKANARLSSQFQELSESRRSLEESLLIEKYWVSVVLARLRLESALASASMTVYNQIQEQLKAAGASQEEMMCCFECDLSLIREIPFADSLKPALDRIQESIDRTESFKKDVLSAAGMSDSHVHTRACRLFQEQLGPEIRKLTPVFYTELLARYRQAFGDRDPRTADALTMLAASLYANGQREEAMRHLREVLTDHPRSPAYRTARRMMQEIAP